ncbi:septum formation initiator family protein [Patescibacteria group bacterium]|nr:septum formation initiator family protein [Patescibacteria group bacterium]
MRGRAERGKKKSWKTFVRWPVFLLANLALLFVLGVSTVRETYRGWTVDREIHALESEADTLEGRKMQLEALTQELISDDRIEYEARARLGRKKEGERVIVLQGFSATPTWTSQPLGVISNFSETTKSSKSNPELWWEYFFHGS